MHNCFGVWSASKQINRKILIVYSIFLFWWDSYHQVHTMVPLLPPRPFGPDSENKARGKMVQYTMKQTPPAFYTFKTVLDLKLLFFLQNSKSLLSETGAISESLSICLGEKKKTSLNVREHFEKPALMWRSQTVFCYMGDLWSVAPTLVVIFTECDPMLGKHFIKILKHVLKTPNILSCHGV